MSKPLVFVIDDNDMTISIIERRLKNKGYAAAHHHGSQGAHKAAIKLKPSLIIMDLYMPDSDGFELIEQFKGHEATKNIPVIGYSASLFESDLEKALKHGFDDVCSKESDPEVLMTMVKKLSA